MGKDKKHFQKQSSIPTKRQYIDRKPAQKQRSDLPKDNCEAQSNNTLIQNVIFKDECKLINSRQNMLIEVKQANQGKQQCLSNKINKTQQVPKFPHALLSFQQAHFHPFTQTIIAAEKTFIKEQTLQIRERTICLRQQAISINERRIIQNQRRIYEKQDKIILRQQAVNLREQQLKQTQRQIHQRSQIVAHRERIMLLREAEANERQNKPRNITPIDQTTQTEAVFDCISEKQQGNKIQTLSKAKIRTKPIKKDKVNR